MTSTASPAQTVKCKGCGCPLHVSTTTGVCSDYCANEVAAATEAAPVRPTTTGQRVRRTQGRPADVGRTGVVTTFHGSLCGDTLVTVTEDSGLTFTAYTRQLQVIS